MGYQFSCLEYSSVLSGCLNSLGLKSRVIYLHPEDVETRTESPVHVIVEVFLPFYDKWVYADAQWDLIPMLNDVPLNAVEFQESLFQVQPDLRFAGLTEATFEEYTSFVAEYLYYFNTFLDHRHAGSEVQNKSKKIVMLFPIGVNKPRTIQGYRLKQIYYTNSLAEFYQNPAKTDGISRIG